MLTQYYVAIAITWTNVDFSVVRFCGIQSPDSNFIVSTQAAILYNDFENYTLLINTTSDAYMHQ